MLSFYVKYWSDRLTGIKTERRTPLRQYAPDPSIWGHKMSHISFRNQTEMTDKCSRFNPFQNDLNLQ